MCAERGLVHVRREMAVSCSKVLPLAEVDRLSQSAFEELVQRVSLLISVLKETPKSFYSVIFPKSLCSRPDASLKYSRLAQKLELDSARKRSSGSFKSKFWN